MTGTDTQTDDATPSPPKIPPIRFAAVGMPGVGEYTFHPVFHVTI